MPAKPSCTYFRYVLPNGSRTYTSGIAANHARCLKQALNDAKRLPDASYIYWGPSAYEEGLPYTGFMLEIIHTPIVCLYRMEGTKRIQIYPREVKQYFTAR